MTIALTAFLLIAAAAVTFFLARESARARTEAQQQFGASLARLVEPALGSPAERPGLDELDARLRAAAAAPEVTSIRLRDATGRPLYEHETPGESAGALARGLVGAGGGQFAASIERDGRVIGRLEIGFSSAHLNADLKDLVTAAALASAAAIASLLALVNLLLARAIAPLNTLTEWARGFAHRRWTLKIQPPDSGSREIRELHQALAEGATAMQHHIRSLEETRELLEHSESRLRKLVNGMREILFELDPDGHVSFVNPAWQALTGFAAEDTLGKPFRDFLIDEGAIQDIEPRALPRLHEKNREIALRTADGKRLWVSLQADAQLDAAGNFTGVIGTLGDITRSVELNRLLSRYQDELYQLSVTDPLTGLYNRHHFDAQLEVILADHLSKNRPVCLLLIDLDGFKFINDTYGHPLGDEVLRATAQLLRSQVRRNDYLARMAGDEFAMVLKNTDVESARRIALKVHTEITQLRIPLPVGHMQLQSSIGVAEAPAHGRNAQDLVTAADVALYHSKRQGRNRIQVLSPDLSRATMSIFSQGFQLRQALEQGHIHPAFQPIYDMDQGKPIAYEVLARLRQNGNVIPAKDFIELAEELGLTRDVDLHIIGEALTQAPADQALFLNVDLSSFSDRAFVKDLTALLKPACAAGRPITIEITERETIPFSDALREDLDDLRAFGCKLALDDFGSGYSTYNFLNQFRPDYLKIEGSFVRGMLHNESDRKIVTHIHELATSFGMQTIAESVENEATGKALQMIGIRNAQGHFYGVPKLNS